MPMPEWRTEKFEEHRAHLRAVAYRILGSISEAEDAVQESWIRLARTDAADVENLRGWLTTVVARVCMDMLRTRTSRREDPWDVRVPDPIVARADGDPESNAMLADSVGLALLVVLDTLEPSERLAFVLHDVFGMTFDEIAPIVDRSPAFSDEGGLHWRDQLPARLHHGEMGQVSGRRSGRDRSDSAQASHAGRRHARSRHHSRNSSHAFPCGLSARLRRRARERRPFLSGRRTRNARCADRAVHATHVGPLRATRPHLGRGWIRPLEGQRVA
ncbi:MAG: sigma-70 family RNA polymerase sigma factor [Luteitalea sp.]|nr:sigma-70 family RNA polymerase sigma factor [Luteitalea sp.]